MKAKFDIADLGLAKKPRSDVRYSSHEEIDAKDVDFAQPKIIELALAASFAGEPPPSRKVVQGWRYFKCEECGNHWDETCRDHATPSESYCPECDARANPYDCMVDESLPIDASGNLIEFSCICGDSCNHYKDCRDNPKVTRPCGRANPDLGDVDTLPIPTEKGDSE